MVRLIRTFGQFLGTKVKMQLKGATDKEVPMKRTISTFPVKTEFIVRISSLFVVGLVLEINVGFYRAPAALVGAIHDFAVGYVLIKFYSIL